MLSQRAAEAATIVAQQPTVSIQRPRGDKVVFFVADTGAGTFTALLQGRAESGDAWHILESVSNADLDVNDTLVREHPAMPQMSVNVTVIAAGASLNARIIS